ncbi:hypothetical protein ACFX15_022249 [Malus domestica]
MASPNSQALKVVNPLSNLFAVYRSFYLCPSMMPCMVDDVALERVVRVHHDVLGGCSLTLEPWGISMYNFIPKCLFPDRPRVQIHLWYLSSGLKFPFFEFVNKALMHY